MQATSAFRLKIGARAMFRAPLDCSPNHLRQAFYLKSSGAVLRPFSGNRILTSQPPATNLFQPLCGISKGVQNVEVAALFNAAVLDPFAGRRTCLRRRRTSPTPASSPPSSRRGRSGRSSATPSRGPSRGAPSSKPR